MKKKDSPIPCVLLAARALCRTIRRPPTFLSPTEWTAVNVDGSCWAFSRPISWSWPFSCRKTVGADAVTSWDECWQWVFLAVRDVGGTPLIIAQYLISTKDGHKTKQHTVIISETLQVVRGRYDGLRIRWEWRIGCSAMTSRERDETNDGKECETHSRDSHERMWDLSRCRGTQISGAPPTKADGPLAGGLPFWRKKAKILRQFLSFEQTTASRNRTRHACRIRKEVRKTWERRRHLRRLIVVI